MEYLFGSGIELETPTAVVVGNFDGLHTGHMNMVNIMKNAAAAKGYKSAVVSFVPHPSAFFREEPKLRKLLLLDEKKYLLEKHGIDLFIELPFNAELSSMSPQRFIVEVLLKKIKAAVLVIGEDYRFGKDRAGDADAATAICGKSGIAINVVPPVHCGDSDVKISSSHIRGLISEKKLLSAKELLGYDYFTICKAAYNKESAINGLVAAPKEQKLLPPDGAYATEVHAGNDSFMCVAKITNGKIEVYLSNKNTEIKEETVRIVFLSSF